MTNATRSISIALALVLVGLWPTAPARAGETYFVRVTGSDESNGRTAGTAFRTIQFAVKQCSGSGNTIFVGPGTYAETIYIGTNRARTAGSGTAAKPNRIIGDLSGAATGDAPGPVVIDGQNTRDFAIRISQRHYWELDRLVIRDQKRYAVYIDRSRNARIARCTLDVGPFYGVYGQRADHATITGNVFERDGLDGHGIVIRSSRGRIKVTRNRLTLRGNAYLGTGFGDGLGWRRRGARIRRPYGILVYSYNTAGGSNVLIANNVVSDYYGGIFARQFASGSLLEIGNNSAAGCTYGICAQGMAHRSEVKVSDNIVASSYFGIWGRARDLTISGLLTDDIGHTEIKIVGRPVAPSGHITDADPLWNAPAAGDFRLRAGSPAIDAGAGLVTVALDIAGIARPFDGDDDGIARPDLGATENDGTVERRPRVVRWRERESG